MDAGMRGGRWRRAGDESQVMEGKEWIAGGGWYERKWKTVKGRRGK